MSRVMLDGVLRMPPDLWDNGPIDVAQRYSRYIQAADRIRDLEDCLESIIGETRCVGASNYKRAKELLEY